MSPGEETTTVDSPELTFVVAAHNSASVIGDTLETLRKRFTKRHVEILVVENASVDETPAILDRILASWGRGWPTLRVLHSPKGFGNALRVGFAASTGRVVVASPDDLPFGFDDLEGAERVGFAPRRVVIGSKAHPQSELGGRSMVRGALSLGFRVLRFAVLGMRIADPQGTYILDGDWARAIAPSLREGGFLITTEIANIALVSGITPIEVPVRLRESHHRTRVAPKDVLQMGYGLVALRRRKRELRAELGAAGLVTPAGQP